MTNHDDLGRLKAEIDRLRSKLGTAELDRHNAEVEADRLRTHVAEIREAVQKYKPIGEIRAILVKFEGQIEMTFPAESYASTYWIEPLALVPSGECQHSPAAIKKIGKQWHYSVAEGEPEKWQAIEWSEGFETAGEAFQDFSEHRNG